MCDLHAKRVDAIPDAPSLAMLAGMYRVDPRHHAHAPAGLPDAHYRACP